MSNIIEYKKILSRFLKLAFYITLLPQISHAQEADLTDDDFYSDIPMVLTVSRLAQPKTESPSSVTIIDREMIKASGARELADILNLVPGFIVGHVAGNKAIVTYQGLGYDFNRQLQVLVDGRSVFIPSFGGIPWESLPVILEDIELIEVTRGPNAATYGSNSFLAVINITTREPYQTSGPNFSISHSDSHKNINDAYFSYSKQLDNYDWSMSFKTQSDNGFDFFNNNTPNHDSKNINKFNLRSNFKINPDAQWSFQLGQSSADLDRGDGSNEDMLRIEKAVNRYQTISYEQSNAQSATSIKFFHTEPLVDDSFDIIFSLTPSIFIPATVGYDRNSERSELEIEKTINWSNEHRMVFGGSFRRDTVDSFFLLGEKQKQHLNVKRLFIQSEYKINERKIINFGAMLEDYNNNGSLLSPRIAYIQHLNKQHTIRLSYSEANRNPILFELFGRQAFKLNDPAFSAFSPLIFAEPNPDLKPEQIHSFEISLNSQFSPQLETDLKLYQYKITKQITTITTAASLNQYINSPSGTKATGLELAISYKPFSGFFIKSGLNIINAASIEEDFDNSFPDKTAFILVHYDINQYHSISGNYHYTSDFNWVGSLKNALTSSNKLDLRYAYHFTVNQNTYMTLEVIGQNLLSDYLDFADSNIQSRSLFLKLSNHF